MNNSDTLISDFYLRHVRFRYVKSFKFFRNLDGSTSLENNFQIVLCNYPCYEGDQKLVITFYNVSELKIGDAGGVLKLDININNISSYQLEGINYKVKEEEHEAFEFNCTSFGFEIL